MKTTRYYVLFPSHTEGIKLESELKKQGIKYTIVPTPRELSVCCGISIMYNKDDEESIRILIDSKKISIIGFETISKEIINPYL